MCVNFTQIKILLKLKNDQECCKIYPSSFLLKWINFNCAPSWKSLVFLRQIVNLVKRQYHKKDWSDKGSKCIFVNKRCPSFNKSDGFSKLLTLKSWTNLKKKTITFLYVMVDVYIIKINNIFSYRRLQPNHFL